MTYYITRLIDGRYKYYWNEKRKQWEGLRDNGTPYTSENTAKVDMYSQGCTPAKVEPINRPGLN